MKKRKLVTISATYQFPGSEVAICPVCEKQNVAVYTIILPSGTEKLVPVETCQHLSDLVSTGRTGVGFLFWDM